MHSTAMDPCVKRATNLMDGVFSPMIREQAYVYANHHRDRSTQT